MTFGVWSGVQITEGLSVFKERVVSLSPDKAMCSQKLSCKLSYMESVAGISRQSSRIGEGVYPEPSAEQAQAAGKRKLTKALLLPPAHWGKVFSQEADTSHYSTLVMGASDLRS